MKRNGNVVEPQNERFMCLPDKHNFDQFGTLLSMSVNNI